MRTSPCDITKLTKETRKGVALMELIIQESSRKISNNFIENLKSMLLEEKDISEFIIQTKKSLDEVGIKIIA